MAERATVTYFITLCQFGHNIINIVKCSFLKRRMWCPVKGLLSLDRNHIILVDTHEGPPTHSSQEFGNSSSMVGSAETKRFPHWNVLGENVEVEGLDEA